ncbi:hypothetical protein IAD21_00303 [Abditibacteriota bacterium]|nr:hypothetical protein IAD21_00303 [Abditibacteriota bacterium]
MANKRIYLLIAGLLLGIGGIGLSDIRGIGLTEMWT